MYKKKLTWKHTLNCRNYVLNGRLEHQKLTKILFSKTLQRIKNYLRERMDEFDMKTSDFKAIYRFFDVKLAVFWLKTLLK